MRLAYVEMSGFRCFRKRTRIDIPQGFLVITGRNGTGKSTVIDAVEFALTGTIGKYRTETGGRESIQDYLWWRGAGHGEGFSVAVGFLNDDGTPVEVRRSRELGSSHSDSGIVELLCGSAIRETPGNICRASIIRDELIAALSWDQTDTARFEFVRTALGARPPVEAGLTIPEAIQVAQNLLAASEREAETVSARVRASLADRSEAAALAQRAADLQEAVASLQTAVGGQGGEISQLLAGGRLHIAQRRIALQAVRAVEDDLVRVTELRRKVQESEYRRRVIAGSETLAALAVRQQGAARAVAAAEARVAGEEAVSAEAASLASLLEAGEGLGLREGRCPLCGTNQEEGDFRQALLQLRRRVSDLSASLLAAKEELAALRAAEGQAESLLVGAQTRHYELLADERELQGLEERTLAAWRRIRAAEEQLPDAVEMRQQVVLEEAQVSLLERHVFVLEASQAVDRIARLEQTIATAREEQERVTARVGRIKAMVANMKEAERAIKRANGEVVDEHLASISPLLSELYYRLRPHRDWRTIDYRIRGDVRRFLSLRVGDDLNPQFMFSSGERRAAGLAFLLAVGLSRQWCRWKTIVLDDPVQHVDDFRALHLVEVLSAIRRDDRQVLCAVEDGELGELMCRRLRSTIESPGARLELEFDGEVGSHIQKLSPVSPLPEAAVLVR